MNTGNLGERITVRLSPELREFLIYASASYGIKPAEFVRQVLYTSMHGYNMAKEASSEMLKKAISEAEEKLRKGMEEDGIDRTSNKHDLV